MSDEALTRIENMLALQSQQVADMRVDVAKVSTQMSSLTEKVDAHLAADAVVHAKIEAKTEAADAKAEKAQNTVDHLQTRLAAYAAAVGVGASIAVAVVKSWFENTFSG